MKYNYASYCISFLLLFFGFSNARAQTSFATETFGSGSAAGTSANGFVGDMGTWTVVNTGVNGASSNNWYVSGEECGNAVGVCGSVCSGGDNSLHISAIGGLCAAPDCGAAYDESGPANVTNQRAESPIIDCTGKGNITLNFNYIAAQDDDDFTVVYTPDGVTWTTISTPVASLCCPCDDAFLCAFLLVCCGGPPAVCSGLDQGLWTAFSIALPPSADNNNLVQIGFEWSNDGNGVGTDPSVAIDDLDITHDIILPVELIGFKGVSEGSLNQLFWTTKSETDNAYFELQHSSTGKFFTTVGIINGQGNSSTSSNYSYRHQTENELNYYRLKQVDLNGEFKYSESIMLNNDLSGIIMFQRENEIIIKGLLDYSGIISIIDASGRLALKQVSYDRSMDVIKLPISSLIKGLYIVTVEGTNGRDVFKIII